MSTPRSSECVTEGVRVKALPQYLASESDPDSKRFIFGYRIRIANEGTERVKLLSRRWFIVDSRGEEQIVEGAGVVGQTPELGPGEAFEYSSYCPLTTPWGTMEGTYRMICLMENGRSKGAPFEVRIARFYLVSTPLPV